MSLFERILMKLFKYHDIIKTVDGQQVVYLRRFYLWRHKDGDKESSHGVFLHHILRSDDDRDPHTHPWHFTTLVLKGGYMDDQWGYTELGQFRRYQLPTEHVRPGRLVKRYAGHTHKVRLHNGPAWTLVFTGPVQHRWGFVTETGWVHWREYLGVPEGAPVA